MEVTDNPTEVPRREEPRTKRAGWILTHGWKGLQGGADVCHHVVELPADLFFSSFWAVRGRQANGSDCIRGGA